MFARINVHTYDMHRIFPYTRMHIRASDQKSNWPPACSAEEYVARQNGACVETGASLPGYILFWFFQALAPPKHQPAHPVELIDNTCVVENGKEASKQGRKQGLGLEFHRYNSIWPRNNKDLLSEITNVAPKPTCGPASEPNPGRSDLKNIWPWS